MKPDIFHVLILCALSYSMYKVIKDDISSSREEIQASLLGVTFLLQLHRLK
ncbi:MAG: hypothetical protein WB421_13910 [Terriglobales bacterium]